MNIAISHTGTDAAQACKSWMQKLEKDITLSVPERHGLMEDLKRYDALLLPGGGDVDPAYYGQEDKQHLCNIDINRDLFEFSVFQAAIILGLPVLGICRGMQLANIAMGGDLIAHLDAEGLAIHGGIDEKDRYHSVRIAGDSMLAVICDATEGTVNSSHHQAIGNVAPGLLPTAWSPDGVIEALEWREHDDKRFLLLVEWHPEKDDCPEAFGNCIGRAFLKAASGGRSGVTK